MPIEAHAQPYDDFLEHLFRRRALQSYGLGLRDRMAQIFKRPRMPGAWLGLQALGLYRQAQLDQLSPASPSVANLCCHRPLPGPRFREALSRVAPLLGRAV